MTVFTIYYDQNNGNILSYIESGLLPPEGQGPEGSARICYDKIVPILDEETFQINMKIDLATRHLIPINVPNIIEDEMQLNRKIMHDYFGSGSRPYPIPDPNGEIRHA